MKEPYRNPLFYELILKYIIITTTTNNNSLNRDILHEWILLLPEVIG